MKEKAKKPLVPDDDSFLDIDKMQLDEEWVEQPKLYHRYSRKLAKCVEEVERADANKKLIYAKLGLEIRESPESFGLTKCTDKAVDDARDAHGMYQEALERVAKAKYNLQLLRGTCDALQHRRESLQNLVKLHFGDYFAEPVADEEDREEMEIVEKRAIRRKGMK